MLVRMQKNFNSPAVLVGMSNGEATLENILAIPKIVKCIVTQQFHSYIYVQEQ